MRPLIIIEDLVVGYGAVTALKGVSLHLEEGEIVAVLGANGAGKTTLLNAISGLVPVANGKILFGASALNGMQPHQIVRLGISQSPEGRKVFSTLTVDENLNLGAYTQQKNTAATVRAKNRVFELFPILSERRRQLAGTLSGGEQQMLAIGRALMSSPRLLLLDEPSLGLAPILVNRIFAIIREINEQGTSILLVEQNAQKALAHAARGYILENGMLSTSGTALELKSNPKVQEAYLGGTALRKRQRRNET